MSLAETLDKIRAGAVDRIPADARAVMHRAVEDLRSSGIQSQVLAVGAQAPTFELPNYDGELVRSEDYLARGPLVVTFYRGFW